LAPVGHHFIPIYFLLSRSAIFNFSHFSNNCFPIKFLFASYYSIWSCQLGTLFLFSCSLKKGKHRPLFDAFRFILRRASSTIRLSSTSMKLGVFKLMLSPFWYRPSHSFLAFNNFSIKLFASSLAYNQQPASYISRSYLKYLCLSNILLLIIINFKYTLVYLSGRFII
jgi:hypothetical protein